MANSIHYCIPGNSLNVKQKIINGYFKSLFMNICETAKRSNVLYKYFAKY